MDVNDLNKVWEIKPLKKVGEDEAKKILENVAKQVQPIMRKHRWRVKLLSEFCPTNPSLLGLNIGGGAEIKLRLRRPDREWDFFPYNQILDTMLHELCHNEHGPHNTEFYKLLDEIRKECEELLAKGVTGSGQGFDLPGRRLGGFTYQPPLLSLRHAALAAAEKRARHGALLPSGPKRLGGDSDIMVALSPIQAAAMAAERRLHDDLWCGSKSFEERHGVMLGKIGSSRGSSESSEDASILSDNPIQTSTSAPMQNNRMTDNIKDGETWECTTCTLINQKNPRKQIRMAPKLKVKVEIKRNKHKSTLIYVVWLITYVHGRRRNRNPLWSCQWRRNTELCPHRKNPKPQIHPKSHPSLTRQKTLFTREKPPKIHNFSYSVRT